MLILTNPIANFLQVTATGGQLPYSYLWNNQANTAIMTPPSAGYYWVVVTDALGCDSDTVFYSYGIEPTSITDVTFSELLIYPNPTKGSINISFTTKQMIDFNIQITNILGEVIYNEDQVQYLGDYILTYDISTRTKGIYFLEIITSQGKISKKIILQ